MNIHHNNQEMYPVNKHDVIDSYLPPAWGGPFVWIRNEAGNLALHSVPKLVGEMKTLVESVKAGIR